MDMSQRPEVRQKLTLSPQVYQGLNILAMPLAEVELLVDQELLENPLLEVEEETPESEESEEERTGDAEEESAWEDWLQQYEDMEDREREIPRDPSEQEVNTEEFVGGILTFTEYMMEQLRLMDLTEDVARAGETVIGSLDRDGFLASPLEEVARLARVPLSIAKTALRMVQQLDPPGVGARDLKEALLIQAEEIGLDEPMLEAIIEDHLDDVANNHYRKIARALRLSEDEVRRLVDILRTLNPRPAGAYSAGPSPGYIVPDVTIRRFDHEWVVIPNSEVLPALRVSPTYRSLLRGGPTVDDDAKRYIKDKIRSAQSFIRNIERRKDTVSRIAGIILEVQSGFFEDGRGDLKPLRLEDVAVELGVHLSTVSRGVTGKYMDTPHGLFELKYFFSGGYRTSTGMDISSTTVKNKLRELLQGEDPPKPLSDQKLAQLLSDAGITVARRTVAKYREELGIEPSWVRKRR